MQPSAYLVNTSRGDVVDEVALTELLAKRHMPGRGLMFMPKSQKFQKVTHVAKCGVASTYRVGNHRGVCKWVTR